MANRMTEDGRYAREIGVVAKNKTRAIKIRGGASKLRALAPEVRNLLLSPGRKAKREKA